ncbi:demethoxyubiquinone hydroxylase family protein [Dyella mobilis]|nr:demethoxyubiquinone hydroxylase family protein [Dyella mobilis]
MKVNHAGEFGAISIYTGQIWMARLRARDLVPELTEFRSHERRHRAIFAAELERRGRPRCKSYALCGAGGFLLGLITGLLGHSAIAATTVAVESVVLRHLEQQLEQLRGVDEAAVSAIFVIVTEEREHHDRSAAHVSSESFWCRTLRPVVALATESVIWLGMRL